MKEKLKEFLIPTALLTFAVAAGAMAVREQHKENEARERLCAEQPETCPAKNPDNPADDGLMILPLSGGGVMVF